MNRMTKPEGRRALLTVATAGALVAACRDHWRESPIAASETSAPPPVDASTAPDADDVSAVEDLMREHGVIRRILVVYRESASRLRNNPANFPVDGLQSSAMLMRTFAEDYHEKKLEEAHIFPALTQRNLVVDTVSTLTAQHQRGRDVTDYILAVTQKTITRDLAEPLARTLESFARMYEEHTAFEDTIVFPAWKKTLSAKELDAIGDRFEDIEHESFGKDGFDDAVEKIDAIEKKLGIQLASLTPPPPPKP